MSNIDRKLTKMLLQGHHFTEVQLVHPTWCDHCDDFIWGLLKKCVQCDSLSHEDRVLYGFANVFSPDCKLTCHTECQNHIVLDCNGIASSRKTVAQEAAAERVNINMTKKDRVCGDT